MTALRAAPRRLLLATLVLAGLAGLPARASAASVQEAVEFVARLLDNAEKYHIDQLVNLPVNGQAIRDSWGLFHCIGDGGKDPVLCVDEYSDKPVGQELMGKSLPSWFFFALDIYVAAYHDDYLALVAYVGLTAVCAVAEVLTGGLDLCGLIQDLYALAVQVYDLAAAFVEFLGDFGEAVVGVLGDAYCATLGQIFGGCDKGGSSPPEAVAYAFCFQPHLAEGAAARAFSDAGYQALRKQYASDAAGYPTGQGVFGGLTGPSDRCLGWSHGCGPPAAIETAAKVFDGATDAIWTSDALQGSVKLLQQAQADYRSPQRASQVNPFLSGIALVAAVNGDSVSSAAASACRDGIKQSPLLASVFLLDPYAMAERWITKHGQKATGLKVKLTWSVCAEFVDELTKAVFPATFRGYMSSHGCAAGKDQVICPDLASLASCQKLMGTIGAEAQCAVDKVKVGTEAAQAIDAWFKANGSKYPCSYGPAPGGSVGGGVNFKCPRPPQTVACKAYLAQHLPNLPQGALTCLTVEDPAYKALRLKAAAEAEKKLGAVAKATMGTSIQVLGGATVSTKDPLVILTVLDLEEFGAGPRRGGVPCPENFPVPPSGKRCFDYPGIAHSGIDGVETPSIVKDIGAKLERAVKQKAHEVTTPGRDKLKDAVAGLAEGKVELDPINQGAGGPEAAKEKIISQASGDLKGLEAGAAPGTGAATPLGGGALADAAGAKGVKKELGLTGPMGAAGAAGPALHDTAAAAGAAVPHMGPAAHVPGAPGPAPSPGVSPPPPPPPPPGAADLAPGPQLTIAGLPAAWNGIATVDTSRAVSSAAGLCQVALDYAVRNAGAGAAGAFRATWTNSATGQAASHPWPALPAGGLATGREVLALKPGLNQLQLALDDLGQVAEGVGEANNLARVTVTVTGTCGAAGLQRGPTLPVQPGLPKPPGPLGPVRR